MPPPIGPQVSGIMVTHHTRRGLPGSSRRPEECKMRSPAAAPTRRSPAIPLIAPLLVASILIGPAMISHAHANDSSVKVDGYLDFRKGTVLIVDGQRVEPTEHTKFEGTGRAKNITTIPIGYRSTRRGPARA